MLRFVFVFIMFAITVGCSPIGIHNVKPGHIPKAMEQKEGSINKIQFSIEDFYINVEGFSKIGAVAVENMSLKDENGLSLINAWKEALLSSIAESKFFNNNHDIRFDIEILIKEINPQIRKPYVPTTFKAEYKILKRDRLVFSKMINSTGKSDEFYMEGARRVRSAYRNAVRINIALFIKELLKNSDKF